MNDREQILNKILSCQSHHILCELATGYGKTRCAIEFIRNRFMPNKNHKILIVVPRLVLMDSWKLEFVKWDARDYLRYITITTYNSFPKFKDKRWDMIVFDEVHHMSDRCFDAFDETDFDYFIGLSATIKNETKFRLNDKMKDLSTISVRLHDAIKSDVLPDPKVLLVPLQLNEEERKDYKKLSDEISEKKMLYERTGSIGIQKHYLALCNQRLKYLSTIKLPKTNEILEQIKDFRSLTFCSTIKETTQLKGCHSIHSKKSKLDNNETLSSFNTGSIDHIATVGILDEGVNLKDCQIGIFNRLNNSKIKVAQKNGRILRHPKPCIIIPYYVNTWEETLMNRMLENYSSDMIETVEDINTIKNHIENE